MMAITPPDWYVRSLNRTTANEAWDWSVRSQSKGAVVQTAKEQRLNKTFWVLFYQITAKQTNKGGPYNEAAPYDE